MIKENALILYMAGSTNLALAESKPLNDIRVHCNSLFSFLSIVNSSHTFLFISSAGAIYGDPLQPAGSKEVDKLFPRSCYGHRNKILEETVACICGRKNIFYTIFRVANPFGLGQLQVKRKGLIMSLVKSCYSGELVRIRGDGLQCRDYILMDDLCKLILIIHSSYSAFFSNAVINVASGKSFSGRECVSIVESTVGRSANVEYMYSSSSFDVTNSSLDSSLLRSLLNSSGLPSIFLDLSSTIKLIDFKSANLLSCI